MVERVELCGDMVRLEPMTPAHVDDLVVAASEDRSTYGLTTVPADREGMRAYVAQALDEERRAAALPFVTRLTEDGRVVGSTRYLDIECWVGDDVPTVVEIGSTWLASSVQRTAANTEAKLLMLGHAFDTWEVERVTFKTDARNDRSRTAIARLGARFEGVRRAHMPATDGGIRDSAFYSIVRAEWPEVRDRLRSRLTRGS
jgi:N-acetyltransferase